MTRFELVLVFVTLALIIASAIRDAREKRRLERARRRAIRRATFAAHRQTIAFRGLMIEAFEARRVFERADFVGSIRKIATILPIDRDETGKEWPS